MGIEPQGHKYDKYELKITILVEFSKAEKILSPFPQIKHFSLWEIYILEKEFTL